MKSQEFYNFSYELNDLPNQSQLVVNSLLPFYGKEDAKQLKNFIEDMCIYDAKKVETYPDFILNVANVLQENNQEDIGSVFKQAKMLKGPEGQQKEDKTKEIAEHVKRESQQDLDRINQINIYLNSKKLNINDLRKNVIENSTDEIFNFINLKFFLKDAYNLNITESQLKFLEMQTGQAGLIGRYATFKQYGFSNASNNKIISDQNNSVIMDLHFDRSETNKTNNMSSISYSRKIDEKDTDNDQKTSRTGKFTITADVSKLATKNTSSLYQTPKKINFTYESDNLPCHVDNRIVNSLTRNAIFKKKPLLNIYYKVTNTIADYTYRPILNTVNKYFPSQKESEIPITKYSSSSLNATKTTHISSENDQTSSREERNSSDNRTSFSEEKIREDSFLDEKNALKLSDVVLNVKSWFIPNAKPSKTLNSKRTKSR